jgi:hypothetical protein
MTVEWMKDGDGEGDTIASRLEAVNLGQDEDGESITSCVVVPSEAPTTSTPRGKRLSANANTMLNMLRLLVLLDLPRRNGTIGPAQKA